MARRRWVTASRCPARRGCSWHAGERLFGLRHGLLGRPLGGGEGG